MTPPEVKIPMTSIEYSRHLKQAKDRQRDQWSTILFAVAMVALAAILAGYLT